jgi:hypothetical protein
MDEESYDYKPLTEPDGIRLIELQPSSDSATAIWCSLIHIRLSSDELWDVFSHCTALPYI